MQHSFLTLIRRLTFSYFPFGISAATSYLFLHLSWCLVLRSLVILLKRTAVQMWGLLWDICSYNIWQLYCLDEKHFATTCDECCCHCWSFGTHLFCTFYFSYLLSHKGIYLLTIFWSLTHFLPKKLSFIWLLILFNEKNTYIFNETKINFCSYLIW